MPNSPRRDPGYLQFVRTHGCCACGHAPPSEAHHVRQGHQGGMGLKPPDRLAVPLCGYCHRRLHSQGERAFWEAAGIDPLAAAGRMYASFRPARPS